MFKHSLLALTTLLSHAIGLPLISADSGGPHPCAFKPEQLGLPDFPQEFTGCWHDPLPANNPWPDAGDFIAHIEEEKRSNRLSAALHNSIAEALRRARTRIALNHQYAVHSCYYFRHPADRKQDRWIQNFLIPLCVDEHSLPECFCTVWNVYPYCKRTIITADQAQQLMMTCCTHEQQVFQDIMMLPWKNFCEKYPAPAAPRAGPAVAPPPVAPRALSKNDAGLLRINDYLKGLPLADETLESPLMRLERSAEAIRQGSLSAGPYEISYPDALSLMQYCNDYYNLGSQDSSPIISLGSPSSLFEEVPDEG